MAKKICLGCMEQYDDSYDICPCCGYAEGTGPKEAYHIMPGTVLQGKYIVGTSIGYGGFGVTYIGYDFALGHKIAIKEYLPGEFSTRCIGDNNVTVFEGEKREQFDSGIDKFVDEAKKLANFKHVEGVVTVYDSFKENNTAYIIMEYLEGKTLKELLIEKGKISFDKAVGYMVPILDALTEIHKDNLLHRDISPDNIFVTNDGRVKLIDFGAARYATTTHSKSLSVIVKPGYAPQEQYRSRGDQGPWTDVYACAATLYKMITGITPEDSMERGEKDTLKPPRKAGSKIPRRKQNAIMNALNLKIEDRTQTTEEFKEELLTENWVTRKKNTLKKMDIGKWPLWVKITSGAGTAAVFTMLILLITGVISFDFVNGRLHFIVGKGKTIVPDVVNYSEAEAIEIVEKQNMTLQVNNQVEDDEIIKGMVLSQTVRAGSEVPEKTILFVTESAGRGTVQMENYVGREAGEVKNSLENYGLPYISEEGESEIAPGYVFEQSIEEGMIVEKGTEVRIKISSGISSYDPSKNTKVPQLVGKTWEDGKKAVREKNLYIVVVEQEYSFDIPAGQIFEQDHEAGTTVKEGEIIGVKISLGIKKIIVPDVRAKYKDDAKEIIEAEGLTVTFVEEDSDTVAKDHVIRQSIEAGTEIEVTKDGKPVEITLYISKGIEGVIPDVSGRTKAEAENILSGSGYTIGNIGYKKGTSKSQDGLVVAQSPQAGRSAKVGASVDITIYQYVDTENGGDDGSGGIVHDDRIEVPNVVGQKVDKAKATLSDKGLSSTVLSYETGNDKSKSEQVVRQNVSAGSKVDKGTKVGLVVYKYEESVGTQVVDGGNDTQSSTTEKPSTEEVSSQNTEKVSDTSTVNTESTEEVKPAQVAVPDLLNSTRSNAETAIKNVKLKVGNVSEEKGNDKSKDGKVTKQNPSSGTKVDVGTSVDITVYKYEANKVNVPNVVGKTEAQAKSDIANAGLKVGKVSTEMVSAKDKSKDGKVAKQSPTAGSTASEGDVVDITVYVYTVKPVKVPNLIGKTEADARNTIENANLVVGVVSSEEGIEKSKDGTVVAQSPVANNEVNEGGSVDITVYKYIGITVPNVVGLNEGSANNRIVEVGLDVGTITYKSDPTKKSGEVISQSISGGMIVSPDTLVDLVVCNNKEVTYYRTRGITYEYKTATSKGSLGSEWEYVSEETKTTYGSWSGWSTTPKTPSDSLDVDTKVVQIHTGYNMYEYNFATSQGRFYYDYHASDQSNAWEAYPYERTAWISVNDLNSKPSVGPGGWSSGNGAGCNKSGQTGYYNIMGNELVGSIFFISSYTYDNQTQYRSRDIIKTTTYTYRKKAYGSWSQWYETKSAASDGMGSYDDYEIDSKTIYWDETP